MSVITLLAFIAQALAQMQPAKNMSDAQDSIEWFVDKLTDRLFGQALKAHNGYLGEMMFGNLGHHTISPCTGSLLSKPRVSSGDVACFQLRSPRPRCGRSIFCATRCDDAHPRPYASVTERVLCRRSLAATLGGLVAAVVQPAPVRASPNSPFLFLKGEIPFRLEATGQKIPVPFLVDTGAAASVMGSRVAEDLGILSQMDRRITGTAEGVGEVPIYGKLTNVPVQFGKVTINIDFYVLESLDLPDDSVVILGIDQMITHRMTIDFESDVVRIGGRAGSSVPILDAGEVAREIQSVKTLNLGTLKFLTSRKRKLKLFPPV